MTTSTFIQNENSRYSIRPSWITTVADLGRIHGDECKLVGVVRDHNALDGKIDYGIASSADVTKLELQLGKRLSELLESGTAIEALVDCNAGRVVDLKPLEVAHTVPVSAATAPSSMLPKLATNGTRPADFANAIGERNEQLERIERQRLAALELRKSWSLKSMKHRSDWAAGDWLPLWIKDLIREGSRHWLELPNAPSPSPEPPPVIQSVITESSESVQSPAVASAQGIVGKLRTAFSL